MLKITLTAPALETVRRQKANLHDILRHLDDAVVDNAPERIGSDGTAALGETDVIRLIEHRHSGAPIALVADQPQHDTPCHGCLFTGRLAGRQRHDGSIAPGPAVCIHPNVPQFQRRSAARGEKGRCGPEARLRRETARPREWKVAERDKRTG